MKQLKPFYSEESIGERFFALEIKVDATDISKIDLQSEKIWRAGHDAAELIKTAIMEAVIAQDPNAMAAAVNERNKLLLCFPGQPFVEEIPNGYCSRYCHKHLPWFVVTTQVGRIKIGWRKSVISIDWSETIGTKKAEELFKDEQTTKGDKMIHAHGYEDAERYIAAIINSALQFNPHKYQNP